MLPLPPPKETFLVFIYHYIVLLLNMLIVKLDTWIYPKTWNLPSVAVTIAFSPCSSNEAFFFFFLHLNLKALNWYCGFSLNFKIWDFNLARERSLLLLQLASSIKGFGFLELDLATSRDECKWQVRSQIFLKQFFSSSSKQKLICGMMFPMIWKCFSE